VLFNSLEFAIFFSVVLTTYWAIPHRLRWTLLLCASYFFYGSWNSHYLVLIVLSTLVDFTASYVIYGSVSQARRRAALSFSLFANLGILFYFKYLNFFADSIARLTHSEWNLLEVVLPVGISFYTFQTMSYTLDVYRGAIRPERHLGVFALYVSFFPQLVAGPIERSHRLLPQLVERKAFDTAGIVIGLRLALWGLFKKVVIADLVGTVVSHVYADPHAFKGPPLVIATVFFAVQIYCDFSGYSDIAIGIARMMGFRLMTNFKQPYLARTIADFWRRWHISLSTWFRDYVYLPLGGSRVPRLRWMVNIMVVFTVSGLWHGANWTFVVWGAIHGVALLLESMFASAGLARRTRSRLPLAPALSRLAGLIYVLSLTTLAWVFFRAESLDDAWWIVTNLSAWDGVRLSDLFALGLPRFEIVLACCWISLLFAVDWCLAERPRWIMALWRSRSLRWGVYLAGIYGIVFFGIFEEVEFIYFQF
jgi:alginate O-acetyltransferase complex protein AlgI